MPAFIVVRRSLVLNTLLCLMLLSMVGCAASSSRLMNQDLFKKRIQAFYQVAAIDDKNAMYEFHSSAFKSRVDKERFTTPTMMGSSSKATDIQIVDIEYSPGDPEATVTTSRAVNAMGFQFTDIQVTDRWIFENGNWFIEPVMPDSAKSLFQ